jgi:CRISPR/Cas system-associated exonuclease Cas4 (RecB family)
MSTTTELLLQWDAERPRTKQTRFGMSELGGCERRAGYRLAGTERTNAGGSVQAILGTAIHAVVADVLAQNAEPGDLVEEEVEWAGILGHLDRYEAATATLVDVKTTTSRWLEHLKVNGPTEENRWQAHGYAAALIERGLPVRTIRIDYIARDTGEEWPATFPFDVDTIRDALAWLRRVRNADLEMLPRAYAPTSTFCGNCPFFTACWQLERTPAVPRENLPYALPDDADPQAVQAARDALRAARDAKKAAETAEDQARAELQRLLPTEAKGTYLIDLADDGPLLKLQVSYSERIDTAAVKQEYAKVGAKPPMKVSDKPSITVGFAPRPAQEQAA